VAHIDNHHQGNKYQKAGWVSIKTGRRVKSLDGADPR